MIMNKKDLKNIFQSGICAIKRNARNKDIWNSILLLSQKFDNVYRTVSTIDNFKS